MQFRNREGRFVEVAKIHGKDMILKSGEIISSRGFYPLGLKQQHVCQCTVVCKSCNCRK